MDELIELFIEWAVSYFSSPNAESTGGTSEPEPSEANRADETSAAGGSPSGAIFVVASFVLLVMAMRAGNNQGRTWGIASLVGFFVVVMALLLGGVHRVHEGTVGVYWHGGAISPVMSDPGIHFMIPYYSQVSLLPVFVQNMEVLVFLSPFSLAAPIIIKPCAAEKRQVWVF